MIEEPKIYFHLIFPNTHVSGHMRLLDMLWDSPANEVFLPTGGFPKKDKSSGMSHGQPGKPELGQELRPLHFFLGDCLCHDPLLPWAAYLTYCYQAPSTALSQGGPVL